MKTITKIVAGFVLSAVSMLGLSQEKNAPKFDLAAVEAKAANGDVVAMVELGKAYWGGSGVAKVVQKGRVWFERAAEKGSLEAEMMLGSAYLSGTNVNKNRELAAKYLLQVAQQPRVDDGFKGSQALAQLFLSMMYEQGSGVEKSHERSLQFLQMAASNGNYNAQYELGSLHNEGSGGMPMDEARACDLFEKAAEQGHVKAMHNAAYCYQLGTGGKKDDGKAFDYYTKAAEAGSARSQRNLGIMYGRSGQPEKAYFWLRIAESSGDSDPEHLLDKLKPTLSPAQVEAQEKEVSAWLSAHPLKKQ